MRDDEPKQPDTGDGQPTDAEIEREIRSRREFSVAEAISRNAGDLMKGASPVTRRQQAEFQIREFIDRSLDDAEGALASVLLRWVKASDELLESYDDPVAALVASIQDVLRSDDSLSRFVTKVDAEWGRIYLERPHFDDDQGPPDREDPYTRESVRATLVEFLAKLPTATESS